jgi:preprotein translocase subunit SecE
MPSPVVASESSRGEQTMSMNRQQKRMLQKQGEIDAEGAPVRARRQAPSAPPRERTTPVQFLREVRGELRKVAWPSRAETINYSVVVLITIIVLTAMIYGLDWLFSTFILDLFEA